MPEATGPTYELPCYDFGTFTGVTVDAEQRACRAVANNSSSLGDFIELMDTLGIWPDPNYQNFLRQK